MKDKLVKFWLLVVVSVSGMYLVSYLTKRSYSKKLSEKSMLISKYQSRMNELCIELHGRDNMIEMLEDELNRVRALSVSSIAVGR